MNLTRTKENAATAFKLQPPRKYPILDRVRRFYTFTVWMEVRIFLAPLYINVPYNTYEGSILFTVISQKIGNVVRKVYNLSDML